MPFFSFHETGRVLRTGLTASSSMSISSWTRVSLLLSESSREQMRQLHTGRKLALERIIDLYAELLGARHLHQTHQS